MKTVAGLALALLLAACLGPRRARRRRQDRRGGGGEFLWRHRPPDRRRPGRGRQHHEQPRPGPASVRDHAGHRAPDRRTRRSRSSTAPTTTRGWKSCWRRRRGRAAPSSPSPTCRAKRPATIRISGTSPPTMPAVAKAIAAAFSESRSRACRRLCGAARGDASPRSSRVDDKLVAQISAKYAGAAVTATEPVFGYMAEALGLTMRNRAFPALHHERHRAERARRRRVRAGPERPQGPVLFYNSRRPRS